MLCTTTKIPYSYGDTIKFKTLFDLHIGNRFCDLRAIRAYLEDSDDKTYFIGGGDLFDAVIVKDEKRYRKSSDSSPQHEDSILDYQRSVALDLLKPYKDKILALGIGNHEDVIVKKCSHNPVKTLCTMLDVPYGGYTYFLQVNLRTKTGMGRQVVFKVHHGWGGGSRTEGADITKYARDTGKYDADVFLYGHGHRLQHYSMPIIGTTGTKLIARDRFVVLCGTFLKTLSNTTDPTYSEIAGYPPVHVGSPTINVKPLRLGYKITVTT